MKLDIYVDVTNVEDWMVVTEQIGTLFQVQADPWQPALALEQDELSKDIKKHLLIFSLNGSLNFTNEQEEFFKTYKYNIWFSKKGTDKLKLDRAFPDFKYMETIHFWVLVMPLSPLH